MDHESSLLKNFEPSWDINILKSQINPEKMPRHIAIIMDGNGRWAREKRLTRVAGHRAGVKAVRDIVEASVDIRLEVLTLYAFSVQNWERPKREVNTLMRLLVEYLKKELPEMMEQDIRMIAIGDLDRLPSRVRETLAFTIEKTKNNKGMTLNLALNYGGKSEICHAAKQIARKIKEGQIEADQIDEGLFSRHLYTADLPDPDLLIRTSGEMRISNFLLWQLAYAEFWITQTLWPDFNRAEFFQAIIDFQKRERRFGRITGFLGRKR
ncbi:isoprenyl transferase [bacterium]|nr:isoprenyl transferase [bacterium]